MGLSLQPGTFWDEKPKGKETKLAGLDAYLSEPTKPSGKAIVLLSDIFGTTPHQDLLHVPASPLTALLERLKLSNISLGPYLKGSINKTLACEML